MTRSVLIIDCTGKDYTGANHAGMALGGIERAIIQLSFALARKGLRVSVLNNTQEPIVHEGVSWIPKKKTDMLSRHDIVIACNDSNLLDEYARFSGDKNFKAYMWFHNRVLLEKTLRKGRMLPLLRWRPVGVFLGAHHEKNATKFLPLKRRVIIGSGVEDEVLSYTPSLKKTRPQNAAFISQPYRGLAAMLRLWIQKIHPSLPGARLRIYAANTNFKETDGYDEEEFKAAGIEFRGRMTRSDLMKDLEEVRVCLIPGHVDETFCLAAAESLAMHIPVITFGTGSLKERVQDKVNGFVVPDEKTYGLRLMDILSDNTLWRKMAENGLIDKENYQWNKAADDWLSVFKEERL